MTDFPSDAVQEWVQAEIERINRNKEIDVWRSIVAPLHLDRPHHHHGAGRDKYDGEVDEAVYYHDGHEPSDTHRFPTDTLVFERKGERWPVGPACLLGRECESYVPEFEG